LSNSITEGRGRELPPNSDGEILRVATSASIDLRVEVAAASTLKDAGQGEEMRARSSIESRTDLRLAATNEAMRADPTPEASARLVDHETARRWADLDAVDFGRVRSTARRENALEAIAGHVRASPEYAGALKKRSPVLAEAVLDINAKREAEQLERARQSTEQTAQAQRSGERSAASKTRETLIDASSLAALANLRATQTARVVEQLASRPETSTKELREAQQALKVPPLASTVAMPTGAAAPSDPDIAAISKRAIKRPIADEELSQALLARFVVSHEKRNILDRGTTEFTYRAGQQQGNVAFVDAGKTLQTSLNDKETIRAMVEVASAKNWKEVTLTGTEDFKRAAWLEARLNGLDVRGYDTRDADRQLLAELQQRDRPSNSMTVAQPSRSVDSPARSEQQQQQPSRKHIDGDALTSAEQTTLANSRAFLTSRDLGEKFTNETLRELESRVRGERVYTGELVEHGRAAYRFEQGNDQSYFAVLKTRNGEKVGEQVVWGKGLEEAMVNRKPGEQIVLQNIGRTDVVVQERVRNAQGQVVEVRPKDAQLNRWKAEPLSQYMARSQPSQQDRETPLRPVMQVYDIKAPVRKSPNKQGPGAQPSRQLGTEPPSKRDRQPGRDR
jgi:hypothetical protein